MKIDYETEKLLELIRKSPTAFHAVLEAEKQLKEAGFEELKLTDSWGINNGGSYYYKAYDSSIYAFTLGDAFNYHSMLRIAAAHTDFPCLRIKPKPDMDCEQYLQLNVEVYGGAILNTWLDRPLSAAGRVTLRSNDLFKPEIRFVDFKRPILTIPNLAIHLNRDVNKGIELNRQKDMQPILGMFQEGLEKNHYFISCLAEEMQISEKDILDFEIFVYNAEAGETVGMKNEFISAPRLDNLTSVQAALTGLIEGRRNSGLNMIALFDNEEVGSKTKQGAGSMMLSYVVEKIYESLGRSRSDFMEAVADGMLLSLDVAHALHPNQAVKSDPVNKVLLNGGITIKEAAQQSYATDSVTAGIIQQICQAKEIPYQKFIGRSDGTLGSTLGPVATAFLPMKAADVGIPMLAMHSSRELMGMADQKALVELVKVFFSLE